MLCIVSFRWEIFVANFNLFENTLFFVGKRTKSVKLLSLARIIWVFASIRNFRFIEDIFAKKRTRGIIYGWSFFKTIIVESKFSCYHAISDVLEFLWTKRQSLSHRHFGKLKETFI